MMSKSRIRPIDAMKTPNQPSTSETKTDGNEENLVEGIAKALNKMASENSTYSFPPESPFFCFSGLFPSSTSILDYCRRIQDFLFYDEYEKGDGLLMALIYIDICLQMHSDFHITPHNVHRVIAAATLVAAKFYCDTYYTNKVASMIFGVTNKELNKLELRFLTAISFTLFIDHTLYPQYAADIKARYPSTVEQPAHQHVVASPPSLMSAASIYKKLDAQAPLPIKTPAPPPSESSPVCLDSVTMESSHVSTLPKTTAKKRTFIIKTPILPKLYGEENEKSPPSLAISKTTTSKTSAEAASSAQSLLPYAMYFGYRALV